MKKFEYAQLEVFNLQNRPSAYHFTKQADGRVVPMEAPEGEGLLHILQFLGGQGWQMCGQRLGDFYFTREVEEDSSQFYYILFKEVYAGIEFHRLYKGTEAQYEVARNVNNLRGGEHTMRCSKKFGTIADVQDFIVDNSTLQNKDINLTKLYNDPVYLADTIS